ncbi:MAG: hypothetical protein GTN36_04160 [Candidatus Aenigmarchaeota archaeon]|nr:hypothetical protein [Candidatus Aenigmarchaeota archaeon]
MEEVKYLTFEEATKLNGFNTPYEVKKKGFELQLITSESFRELPKRGSRAFIDGDKRLYINIGEERYFVYVGSYDGGFILSREPVVGVGLSLNTMAKVLTKESSWKHEKFMKRFKTKLGEHIKILEEAGLVDPSLKQLTLEMAEEIKLKS